MKFKGFTLDEFQIKAIESIDNNNSCVVSASTGTGKTLIAEYIINKHLPEGNTIIYTAPIKALSNQKYKDFCADYGKENVGLLTGDIAINARAGILIMTTEIYRNMLLSNDPLIDNVTYVIFDEIHYINDIQRGTVWEESLIFSPDHVRFLALSATIPNYREFAAWIEKIKHHKVDTVFYGQRAVPLTHKVYDTKLGLTTISAIEHDKLKESEFDHGLEMIHRNKKGKKYGSKFGNHHAPTRIKAAHHLEVIPAIKDKIPALYFCFSRKKCEDYGKELAAKKDYLTTEENMIVTNYIREHITPEIASMRSTKALRKVLPKGIGYHHSGMLPALKQIVEHLFGQGLIKMLYTTETFSVGINMPAKTVIFNSLEKYDGVSTRMLNAKEYFQIAGRAGRRGIDTEGLVIACVNRKFTNLKKLAKISSIDDEPIISRFTLSTNTVINLIDNFDEQTQERVLKSSFDYYTRTQQNQKAVHVMASFKHKLKVLKKLNYIVPLAETLEKGQQHMEQDRTYALTVKGRFAKYLYSNEIPLTELFHLPFLHKIQNSDLLIILAALTYEERRLDYFMIKGSEKTYQRILKTLERTQLYKDLNKTSLKRMINFVTAWAQGSSFTELMTFSNLAEGDIIRFFRRLVDTLTQLQRASEDERLKERLETIISLINRDMVSAYL